MIDAVAAKSNPDRYVIGPAARLASQRDSGNGAPVSTSSPREGDVVVPLSASSSSPHAPMMSMVAKATVK